MRFGVGKNVGRKQQLLSLSRTSGFAALVDIRLSRYPPRKFTPLRE